ncbi:hypothetical protein [Streptomyces sp. NPDC014623]|uniref:hypothetical protein n=1 Tax=Streptomyces sp. NPDC014623 TaxID=3364875 RepID=UPI003701DAED
MHDRTEYPQPNTPTRSTERQPLAWGIITRRGERTITLIATEGSITSTSRCALAPSDDARTALGTIADCLTTENPTYPMTGPDRRRLAALYASAEWGVGETEGASEPLMRELLRHMPPITDRRTTRRAYAELLRPALARS